MNERCRFYLLRVPGQAGAGWWASESRLTSSRGWYLAMSARYRSMLDPGFSSSFSQLFDGSSSLGRPSCPTDPTDCLVSAFSDILYMWVSIRHARSINKSLRRTYKAVVGVFVCACACACVLYEYL